MPSKADISLQVIIIAVVALVVLVVVIMIFSQQSGGVKTTIGSCSFQGGTCMPASSCTSASGRSLDSQNNLCPTKGDVCCIGTFLSGPQKT